MKGKLCAACMAAFAAFVIPASASATPVLTNGGTAVGTGTKIVGTGIEPSVFTAGTIRLECSSSTLTGELTKNNGTEVEGTITSVVFAGTDAAEDCTSNSSLLGGLKVTTTVGNGTPWCLSAKSTYAANEFQVRGNACNLASRSITFALDGTTLGSECKYERTTTTGPVKGTYTTAPSDAVLSTNGSAATTEFKPESTNAFGCPGAVTLTMSLTLETDASSASPLSIS